MFNLFLFFALLIGALIFVAWITDKLGFNSKMSYTTPCTPNMQLMGTSYTQTMEDEHNQYYECFLENVFIPCIRDCYKECGLSAPGSKDKHIAPSGNKVLSSPYGIVFQYDFIRAFSLSGGLNSKKVYSTIKVEEMSAILGDILYNHCISAGDSPAYILDQYDLGNGKVRFVIGRR